VTRGVSSTTWWTALITRRKAMTTNYVIPATRLEVITGRAQG
jgi:hypothetical protein